MNLKKKLLVFQDNYKYIIGLLGLAVLSSLIYWYEVVKPAEIWQYYGWSYMDPLYLVNGGDKALVRLILSFAILGLAYLTAWQWAKKIKGKAGWMILIAGTGLFSFLLLYLAPFGSNDIYDYISHGRILGIYHADPFRIVGSQFPEDIFTYYMGWPYTPSAYGPLWEILAGITAIKAGEGVMQNVIAFKLLSGIFLLGSIVMVALILHRKSPQNALAGTLLLAWNPVVLFEIWGNGHNDMSIVFWILVAIWAIDRRFFTVAIMALVAGILFKYMPVLLLPAAGLVALQLLPNTTSRQRFILVTFLLASTLVVVTYAPFWHGFQTLSVTRRAHLFTTSLASTIFNYLAPTMGQDIAAAEVSKIAAGLTALFTMLVTYWVWKKPSTESFSRAAFVILAFYLLGTVLWFWSWYAVWLIGLAPVVNNRYMRNLAVLLGFSAMTKHFITGPLVIWPRVPVPHARGEFWLMVGVFVIPWLYLAFIFLKEQPWRGWAVAIPWNRVPSPESVTAINDHNTRM